MKKEMKEGILIALLVVFAVALSFATIGYKGTPNESYLNPHNMDIDNSLSRFKFK